MATEEKQKQINCKSSIKNTFLRIIGAVVCEHDLEPVRHGHEVRAGGPRPGEALQVLHLPQLPLQVCSKQLHISQIILQTFLIVYRVKWLYKTYVSAVPPYKGQVPEYPA